MANVMHDAIRAIIYNRSTSGGWGQPIETTAKEITAIEHAARWARLIAKHKAPCVGDLVLVTGLPFTGTNNAASWAKHHIDGARFVVNELDIATDDKAHPLFGKLYATGKGYVAVYCTEDVKVLKKGPL